jgi:hypothetical protein
MKDKATVYFLNTNTRLHQYNLYYCQRVSLIYPDCSRMSFYCLDYGIACTLLGLFSGRALLLHSVDLFIPWVASFQLDWPISHVFTSAEGKDAYTKELDDYRGALVALIGLSGAACSAASVIIFQGRRGKKSKFEVWCWLIRLMDSFRCRAEYDSLLLTRVYND